QKGLVHFQGLHKLQVVETAFVAQLLRRDAELLAEGASEGLVRTILGGERDIEDVARAARQCPRRLAQSPRAEVAHGRLTEGGVEGVGEVMARDAANRGDLVQGDRVAIMAFDEPERLAGGVHAKVNPRNLSWLLTCHDPFLCNA